MQAFEPLEKAVKSLKTKGHGLILNSCKLKANLTPFLLCNMSGYDFGPALVVFVLGFANLLQNSTTNRDKGDQVGIFLKNENVMYILLLL